MLNSSVLTVDYEPQVLNAIERDLRTHYGRQHFIAKAGLGSEALDAVQRLRR